MADTGAIRAGRAFVEISANDAKLRATLAAVQARLRAFGAALIGLGTKIAAVGAIATIALLKMVKSFVQQGDQLQKMAIRTGASVEALSELVHAANLSGTSIEALEKGLRNMARILQDAGDGMQEGTDALNRLGLSIEDLKGLKPEDQFSLLAERVSQIADPTERAAAALELFGRSGAMLLPLMQDGARGIAELRKQARDLGLTISGADADAAAELGDRFSDLAATVKRLVFEIGAALAPSVQKAVNAMRTAIKSVLDWGKANREILGNLLKVTLAVTGIGVALIVAGIGFKLLAFAIGVVLLPAKLLIGTFIALKAVVLALLTPTAAIIAAFGALVAVIATKTRMGREAIGALGDAFQTVADDAKMAFGSIAASLSRGDIPAAVKVLWAFLKLEFARGVAALKLLWFGIRDAIIDGWHAASDFVLKATSVLVNGLRAAWVNFRAFFENLWTHLKQVALDALGDIAAGAAAGAAGGAASDAIRVKADAASEARARDAEAARAEIEARRQRELAGIGQNFEDDINAINAEAERRRKGAENRNVDAVNDLSDELARARKEFADAVAAANQPPATTTPATQLVKALGDPDGALGFLKDSSTRGIFNPQAIQSLQGAGDIQVRQLKAIEKVAEGVDDVEQAIRESGLAFT